MNRTFILSIPMIAPSPNVLRRKYRFPKAYMKLRKLWESSLAIASGGAENLQIIRKLAMTERLRVSMLIHHGGEYDPDNLQGSYKVVLDALCNIGFIPGDRAKDIDLLPARQLRSPRNETVVKIETVQVFSE